MGLLDALARIGSEAVGVYLLVEPSVLAAHPGEFDHAVVTEIRTGRFIFSEEAVGIGVEWHARVGFDAVLPGKEHAVRAAAQIASKLGMGYPGDQAVAACTDKLEFRRVLAAAGIASPRFGPVRDVAEVARFFDDGGAAPIVLKPRNRNGSLGVRHIGERGEIAHAWAQSVGTDEGIYKPLDRVLEFDYLVEDYLSGPEFSVELLVSQGRIVFTNITAKTVGELPWFAEMSHRVPAVVPDPLRDLLLEGGRGLVSALAVQDGLLHSEWRIHDGQAYPIECAVRFPGDRIGWLIELVYEFNLAQAWLACLDHTQSVITASPGRCAATQFLNAAPGKVVAVHCLETVVAEHDVREMVVPRPGEIVAEARDSHSRTGFAVLTAENQTALQAAIDDFAAIRVETR
ncbi:ATP-grasp domain-containing protein [Nocardia noduli]|uniref:ATP-grasp domain-containing protein n=1 Tax=Nocardia noduli TaxID=2815722 RepID=UPI001C24F4C7|nr:ATP-grasp domain-containing protein [Nocardia noduli]